MMAVLDWFWCCNLEMKSSAYQFFQMLCRITNPLNPFQVSNLYHKLCHLSRLWRLVKKLRLVFITGFGTRVGSRVWVVWVRVAWVWVRVYFISSVENPYPLYRFNGFSRHQYFESPQTYVFFFWHIQSGRSLPPQCHWLTLNSSSLKLLEKEKEKCHQSLLTKTL